MARRFVAFDIETAKDVPGEDFNWRPHRPLGISCAATLASDSNELRLWHGRTDAGSPAPRMTAADVLELVQYLTKLATDGFTILSWTASASILIFSPKNQPPWQFAWNVLLIMWT